MYIFLVIIAIIFIAVSLFMQQPKFGKLPSGERLRRIQQSPNYKNGQFQNQSHTPNLAEDVSPYKVMMDFFFGKKSRLKPTAEIPSLKTNLHELDINQNVLVWFGHSSYFMQVDGKRILVDPVFSGAATPMPFGLRAFKGSNNYSADDIPVIDFLFVTHDHWDHLDYVTIKKLRPKIKQVISGLGTGEHLEYWGYDQQIIIEKDWNETVELGDGFTVHTVPGRHFSGRTFKRNKSLWLSFVLQTPTMQIFIGGDSGYDKHFAEIGKRFGSFDWAIIENGQYNRSWRYIHLLPDEILKASKELGVKRLVPVHSSKFALALHPWDEPLRLIAENAAKENFRIATPMIGELVDLKSEDQVFKKWWEGIA